MDFGPWVWAPSSVQPPWGPTTASQSQTQSVTAWARCGVRGEEGGLDTLGKLVIWYQVIISKYLLCGEEGEHCSRRWLYMSFQMIQLQPQNCIPSSALQSLEVNTNIIFKRYLSISLWCKCFSCGFLTPH